MVLNPDHLLNNGNIRLLIGSALAIVILAISYQLSHYLMRFRIFERLIIYTSLTHYKFWRRYKGIKHIEK